MSDNNMSALARLEVMELIARYQVCLDDGDVEAFAANFIADGSVESPSGTYRGHEEIKGLLRDLLRRGRIGGEPPVARHFVSMPYIVSGDDERCRARTSMLTFGCDEQGDLIADTHWTYLDDIVRHDGKWLFERRKFQVDLRSRRTRVSTPDASSP
jgi:hypothetical protein